MSYKPVVCELKLLKRDFVPALKVPFTNKKKSLLPFMLIMSPYLVVRIYAGLWYGVLYVVVLFGVLMLLYHKECISR